MDAFGVLHSAKDGEDSESRKESDALSEIKEKKLRTAFGQFVVEFKSIFTAAEWNVGHPEDDSRWSFIVAKAARRAADRYYSTYTHEYFKAQQDNDLANRIFFEEVENLTQFVIDQTAQLLLKETVDEKVREEKAAQQVEFVAKIKELFFPKYIDLVKKEITDHGPFRPTHRDDYGQTIEPYCRDDIMLRVNFWFWCTYPFVVRLLRCVSPSVISMVLQPPAKEEQAAVLEKIVKEQPSIMEGGVDCAQIPRNWFLAWEYYLNPNSQQQQQSPPSASDAAIVPYEQREYSSMDAQRTSSTEPDISSDDIERRSTENKAAPAAAPVPPTAPSLFTVYYSYDTNTSYDTEGLKVKDGSNIMYVSPATFDTLWLWFGGGPMLSSRVDAAKKLPVFRKGVKVAFGEAQTSPRITVFIWPTMTAKSVLDLAFSMAPPEALALWKGVDRMTLVKKATYQYNEDDFLDSSSSVQPFIEQYNETKFVVAKALAPGSTRYKPGQCGLQNIGNTCYLNSGLQCLSNCPLFRQCILDQLPNFAEATKDAATKKVTAAFQALLRIMWSGNVRYTTTTHLKAAIGERVRRFSSYEQQDSNEFVNSFLDLIHEELNTVKQKKFRERSEEDEHVPVSELAKIYWEDHRKNNQSPLDELFFGLMKSRLECLACGKTTVVFDPFSCLPVSIERLESYSFDVRVYLENSAKMISARVRLALDSPIVCLRDEICKLEALKSVDAETLIMVRTNAREDELSFPGPETPIGRGDVFLVVQCARIKEVTEFFRHQAEQEAAEEKLRQEAEAARKAAQAQSAAEEKKRQDAQAAAKKAVRITEFSPPDSPSTTAVGPAPAADPLPSARLDDIDDIPPRTFGPEAPLSCGPIEENEHKKLGTTAAATAKHPGYLRFFVFVDALPDPFDYSNNKQESPKTVQVVLAPADITEGKFAEMMLASVPSLLEPVPSNTAEPDSVEAPVLIIKRLSRTWHTRGEWQHGFYVHTITTSSPAIFETKGYDFSYPTLYVLISVYFDSKKYRVRQSEWTEDATLRTVPTNAPRTSAIALDSVLESATKTQIMNGMDQWYCPRCKKHQDAKKEERMWISPKYLIVQLKRFRSDSTGYASKNEAHIDIPVRLDVRPYLAVERQDAGSTDYRLCGVVHHSGTLSYGHYTADALCGDAWVNYNDQFVTAGEAVPPSNSAYILFFERMDCVGSQTPPTAVPSCSQDGKSDVQDGKGFAHGVVSEPAP